MLNRLSVKYFLIFALIISGCSSVNELAKYDLSSQKFLFKNSVKSTLTSINVSTGNTASKDKDLLDVIIEIAGETYVSDEVRKKLNKVFKPDNLALEISEGVMEALQTYYNITPVESLQDNPAYVTETRLENFEIISSESGLFTKITAEVKITSRRTGALVWRNHETVTLPLEESVSSYTADKTERKLKSVINLSRLLSITEKELEKAIDNTASQVGYNLSDDLRDDIANARKGK
jgi:ABC-type uncharacterized transport system auxiliary subunit